MKLLVAIPTCQSLSYPNPTCSHISGPNARADWCRKTWADSLGECLDVRFFHGRDFKGDPRPDEVVLDCGDSFRDLREKVRAICRWALSHGYDRVVKIDDDVFVDIPLFLSRFRRSEYRGHPVRGDVGGVEAEYASGAAYQIGPKAMQVVAAMDFACPYEDRCVGWALSQAGIALEPSDEILLCWCDKCARSSPPTFYHCDTAERRALFFLPKS